MIYKILKDGKEINRIKSDENFCKAYCDANNFTYELEDNESENYSKSESTDTDVLNALLGVI